MMGKIIAFVFIKIIYRKIIKVLIPNKFLGGCVFRPTCSEYAIEALNKYGVIKAIFLIRKRFSRCDGKKISYGLIDEP